MLKGLNREAGVRPALSRNCNGEQSRICPLGKPEKARPSDDPKPGELPVLTSVKTCDAQGGYMCTVYLIENSKGDYIHVLGDDDLLAPNFYATLLPFLRQKRYGMICTGVMCSRDIDCREIVIKDSAFIRMLDEEPPSEFIKRIMWIGGLISSVIISRAAWNLGKDTETTRYKLYQTFAKELYGIIKLGSPCLFYSMPLLIQRCGQKHTFIGELLDSTILGRANLFKDLDNASPGIYKIFKEKELSTSQLAMTTSLMIYNRKHYRTQIKEYREHLKRKQYAWLYFWLYTPFPRLMRSILLPFVWLYNRWIQPRGANAFK